MGTFFKHLFDPSTLIGAALLALLLAPVQKYITDLFYSIAGKASVKWADRKKRKEAERIEEITLLATDANLLIFEALKLITAYLGSLLTFILAIVVGNEAVKGPHWLAILTECSLGLQVICAFIGIFFFMNNIGTVMSAYRAYRRAIKEYIESRDREKQSKSVVKAIPSETVKAGEP